ncbi:MAG TPA: response regulator transcription factor [Rhizomicrobium sp.]|nr:response regulator transcription factor [Rhizomicrobium sp.]
MRILIADDHPLYREALRAQIERLIPDAAITETASLDDAAAHDGYALYLLDYNMPGMSPAALKNLVNRHPGVPVAIISGSENNEDIRAVIAAGARGFIPKTATPAHLSHALQILLAGGTSVPAEGLSEMSPAEPARQTALDGLTSRELEVLAMLVRGLSNKEIGRELGLAEVTVKLHFRTIFRKIGARSRAEAAVIAVKAGF